MSRHFCTMTSRRTVAALLLQLLLGSLLLLLPNGSHAFSTVPRSSLVNTRQLRSIRASRDVLSGQDQRSIVLFSISDGSKIAAREPRGGGGGGGGTRAVIMGRIRQFFTILSIRSTKIKRIVAMLVLAAALTFGNADPALAGRSGGRAGGSFGRSCSPPISRMGPRPGSMGRSMGGRGHCSPSMRSSPMLHPGLYRRHPAIYLMPRPNRGLDSTAVADAPTETPTEKGAASAAGGGDAATNPEETIQMNDLVATNGMASPNAVSNNRGTRVIDPITYYAALTGVYGLVMYKANKGRGDRSSDGSANKVRSALGPGVSVGSITVSLDVSDRDDPNCILGRIGDIVKKAKTNTRKGVQSLIADVALEVLRQEASVSSACSTYSHLSGESAAERTYYQMSTVERSKFERESVNKFGGKKASLEIVESEEDCNGMEEQHESKATSAVVTILLQIEGDQTKIPSISSRTDLKNALLRIAADAQIEDCLLSAEVLWTPERRGDIMSREDVASLYPELVIL